MGVTTCYSPNGTIRVIQYGNERPEREAPQYFNSSENCTEWVNGAPPQTEPGRRGVLRGAARALLGVSAVGSTLAGFQGLLGQGLASVPGEDGVGQSNIGIPERLAPAPRMAVPTAADRREWEAFRARFIDIDGRVVDTGNKGVSHTEGQGWGLLFAVAFDDLPSFERILSWTNHNLGRPNDTLHAWRYIPGQARPVTDLNNATDGDLFIAWALWRAAYRWQRPEYAIAARAIARDVLRLLVRPAGARTVLLPAAFGFERGGFIDLNLSYYCFPALRELAQALPSPLWTQLHNDGLAMISEGRFGRWKLPPDWLSIDRRDGRLEPAAGWPARFSFDAIRVPLYLSWSGLIQPQVQDSFSRFWRETNPLPAWVDLRNGNLASYPAPPGIEAVAKIATASSKTVLPKDFPVIRASTDYYSAALILLARLAWQEGVSV
jgi:endoglucanase